MNELERLILQLGKASMMAHMHQGGEELIMTQLIIAEVCNHLWRHHIDGDDDALRFSREACHRLDARLGSKWRDIDTWDGA